MPVTVPCFQSSITQLTHQPEASCSIDDIDVLTGQQMSQFLGCLEITCIYFSAGSAIYAYVFYRIHRIFSLFCKDRDKVCIIAHLMIVPS